MTREDNQREEGLKHRPTKVGTSTFYAEKQVTLKNFYDRYEHKARTCPTCNPYIPEQEISDHPYALTYHRWQEIIKIYFKYLCLFLCSGQVYRFSGKSGEFRIEKRKNSKRKNVDYNRTIRYYMEKEGIESFQAARKHLASLTDPVLLTHKNEQLDGWRWNLVWYRREYKMAFKYHWRFTLSQRFAWRFIDKVLKEHRLINNIVLNKLSADKQ